MSLRVDEEQMVFSLTQRPDGEEKYGSNPSSFPSVSTGKIRKVSESFPLVDGDNGYIDGHQR